MDLAPYHKGDNETNIEELGIKLSDRFNRFCEEYQRLTLIFEPGKFLVSDRKFLMSEFNQTNNPTIFAQADTGFNHF